MSKKKSNVAHFMSEGVVNLYGRVITCLSVRAVDREHISVSDLSHT